MTPLDDITLMKNLATGDRQALRVLYERHAEFVHRVAYRFLGNGDDARDVTQSVFVTLLQSAHRYRPGARLTTWIYRIVTNRCLNHRSKASRRLRTFLTDREFEDIPAPEENQPDQTTDRSRQRARLQTAMLALPERQQMALILSHFEGQSYEEIADALGCSRSSVQSLLFRARQSLLRLLAK